MIAWWHYLLLVNFYLILFLIFYRMLLKKETFFQLNRIYLVSASVLSFLIPLIQSDWVRQLFITRRVQQTLYATIDPEFIYHVKPAENAPLNLGQIFSFLYLFGAATLLSRLIYQLIKIKALVKDHEAQTPFSFFNVMSVNGDFAEKDIIIAHEEVHIKQWHSADVLLIEAITIINWFNPAVYFYRKAIKHTHEFIADRKAVQTGTSKADYALLLLSQTFGTIPTHLTNTFFNQSLLRQRILMLNQDESRKRALFKYGLSAPLFAIMLVFSSATVNNSSLVHIIDKKTNQTFAITTSQLGHTTMSMAAMKSLSFADKKPAVVKSNLKYNIVYTTTTTSTASGANTSLTSNKSGNVFSSVEQNPQFPGGDAEFSRFISEHIKYPEKAKQDNVSGRVFIQFVVEQDGSLDNFKTLRDPGAGLADEAQRVLAISPKWLPGIQNGKRVRVQYTVPVMFSLDDNRHVDTVKAKSGGETNHMLRLSLTSSDTVKRINISVNATAKSSGSTNNILNSNVLFILNGKEISRDDFNKLDVKTISKINVLKYDAAKNYGEKGKNGVILIDTDVPAK